jgi:GNAT superfamily N-acetyltransferase
VTAPKDESFEPPQRLSPSHVTDGSDSGSPQLDDWLKRRALRNEAEGASRTYVICQGSEVVAFYCLANGAVMQLAAPGSVRRKMPDPLPVMVLGRLAVDRRWQGRGFGRALVRDAILRTFQAADIAGIRAILVHAKDQRAKAFYERCGFLTSPIDPLMLMLRLKDAAGNV